VPDDRYRSGRRMGGRAGKPAAEVAEETLTHDFHAMASALLLLCQWLQCLDCPLPKFSTKSFRSRASIAAAVLSLRSRTAPRSTDMNCSSRWHAWNAAKGGSRRSPMTRFG
jgi:hypothetical protein